MSYLAGLPIVKKLLGPFQRVGSKIGAHKSDSQFYGWRMGVLIGSCMSATILLFNIIVVIVVGIKVGFKDGQANTPFYFDPAMA